MFYRFGSGLLPAELQQPTPADGSQATSLLGYRSEHPIFQFLRSRPGLLPSATVGRYFPVSAGATTRRGGRSRSFCRATRSSSRSSSARARAAADDDDRRRLEHAAAEHFYLPFVQSAVRYLAAESGLRSNVDPTMPIRLAFADDAEDRRVTLKLPDGTTRPLPILRFTSRPEVRYDGTDRLGGTR